VVLGGRELEKIYDFTIKEIWSAVLGHKEYFVLMVTSPSLDALRCRYNMLLQPKYKNVRIDFHITIGVRCLDTEIPRF